MADDDFNWDTKQKSSVDFFEDAPDESAGNGKWMLVDPMVSRLSYTLKDASLKNTGSSDILSYQSKKAVSSDIFAKDQRKAVSISEASKALSTIENETDVKKLQLEIAKLKRKLEERFEPLPVYETVQSIVLGKPFALEPYKAKEQKLELIEEAVKWSDGNAILVTVLFFKKTVERSLFNGEMSRRPIALNHYISYLLQRYEISEAVDLLVLNGRNEEAAMVMYHLAVRSSTVDGRIKKLKFAHQAHFQSNPALSLEKQIVSDHVALLEQQQPIDKADSQDAANPILGTVPRDGSLVGKSAVSTLNYCSLYHWNESSTHLASPVPLTRMLRLSDRQYSWAVLMGRSRAQAWSDLNLILTTKNFLGRVILKGVLPIEKVARIMSSNGAPPQILTAYLKLLDSNEKKLALAKRFRCHELVIDTLVAIRDRVALEQYKNQLQYGSGEHNYACYALQASTNKWR